jgi:hypothetical protein
MLDGAFPGQCWHAFIPAADATAQLATRSAYSWELDSHHLPGAAGDVTLHHVKCSLTQNCTLRLSPGTMIQALSKLLKRRHGHGYQQH